MSIRLMSLVWETPLPDSEKLVLLALADWANDDGLCWPSMSQLIKKCSKGERTVQNAIAMLKTKGHVERIEIPGKGCRYIVHPIARLTPAENAPREICTPAKSAPAQPLREPPQPLHPTPAESAPNTSKNHQEPLEESADALRPEHVFEGFQDLMKAIGRNSPRDLTPERRQLIRGRITQYPLDDFLTVFAKCRDSPFLRGDRGRTPLTIDWLMHKKNFQKVLEGNYDD